MRAWRPFVFASIACLVACNAIVGFNELQKVGSAKTKDGGPEEEEETDGKPKKDSAGAPGLVDGGPRCNLLEPFGDAVLMELDQEATTHSAILSPDELEMFWVKGEAEYRHARRESRSSDSWTITTDTLDPSPENSLSIAAGGLKLYYWQLGIGDPKSLKATRTSTSEPFGVPVNFLTPKSNPVFVVSSDDEAYFIESVDGGDQIIKVGSSNANGTGGGKEVENLHIPGSRANFPVLNVSQTFLYFSSNRPGNLGGYDTYAAHRVRRSDKFGAATHVLELNSGGFDQVTWVSDDNCEVMLDRSSHVYRARRPL